MAAGSTELSKVDSAISDVLSSSPNESKLAAHRRKSSSVAGVYNINDLGMSDVMSSSSLRITRHQTQCRIRASLCSSSRTNHPRHTEKEGTEIAIAPETQKLNWKLNTSPASLGEPDILKKFLCTPPVKKIDLHFPLGLEVVARNMKGVTIKDALDAIYKQFKKKVRSAPCGTSLRQF